MSSLTVRIMTWNVRFPNPADQGDLWDDRRDMAVRMSGQYGPDITGVQEAYRVQLDYLARELPGYSVVGRERWGMSDEEHCAILVRSDRFMIESSGTFWLSETPDVPASRTWWPDDHPRVATWVRLRHLASGTQLAHFNTHFTLGDEELRARSAFLLWERLRSGDVSTVVTGDFNSRPGRETYRLMTGADTMPNGSMSDLIDAWELGDERVGPIGTVHGFSGKPKSEDARIDWILVRGALTPRRTETVTFAEDGKYPSDHFPVVADIELDDVGREGR